MNFCSTKAPSLIISLPIKKIKDLSSKAQIYSLNVYYENLTFFHFIDIYICFFNLITNER